MLQEFLGWCFTINLGFLMFSFLLLSAFKGPIKSIHRALFAVNEKDLELMYFQYLAYYKILIVVFILAPYLALRIMN